MSDHAVPQVFLRAWSSADAPLLARLLGDPETTHYIGGPESPEQLASRHQRYLDMTPPGEVCAVTLEPDGPGVGWVGYWESEWLGEAVWEAGWNVLPECQGRGIATAAVLQLLDRVAAEGTHPYVEAYPRIDNAASNAVCRKSGFELLEEVDVEYPPGSLMRANRWRFDLTRRGTGMSRT